MPRSSGALANSSPKLAMCAAHLAASISNWSAGCILGCPYPPAGHTWLGFGFGFGFGLGLGLEVGVGVEVGLELGLGLGLLGLGLGSGLG